MGDQGRGDRQTCDGRKADGLTAFEADAMIFTPPARQAHFSAKPSCTACIPRRSGWSSSSNPASSATVRLIRSSFGFAIAKILGPGHRLFANDLAGGGILDVGGYVASLARLVAGVASGGTVAEPDRVAALAHLGETGADEIASAILHFPTGLVAELSCSIVQQQDNVARIYGGEGRIEVESPWFAGHRSNGTSIIRVIPKTGEPETIEIVEPRHLYSFEAEAASAAILEGRTELAFPGMSQADTLGNLRVLDQWRSRSASNTRLKSPAAGRRR
jgi:predicted dehydrogenase